MAISTRPSQAEIKLVGAEAQQGIQSDIKDAIAYYKSRKGLEKILSVAMKLDEDYDPEDEELDAIAIDMIYENHNEEATLAVAFTPEALKRDEIAALHVQNEVQSAAVNFRLQQQNTMSTAATLSKLGGESKKQAVIYLETPDSQALAKKQLKRLSKSLELLPPRPQQTAVDPNKRYLKPRDCDIGIVLSDPRLLRTGKQLNVKIATNNKDGVGNFLYRFDVLPLSGEQALPETRVELPSLSKSI
jgi:hypothetical protein